MHQRNDRKRKLAYFLSSGKTSVNSTHPFLCVMGLLVQLPVAVKIPEERSIPLSWKWVDCVHISSNTYRLYQCHIEVSTHTHNNKKSNSAETTNIFFLIVSQKHCNILAPMVLMVDCSFTNNLGLHCFWEKQPSLEQCCWSKAMLILTTVKH